MSNVQSITDTPKRDDDGPTLRIPSKLWGVLITILSVAVTGVVNQAVTNNDLKNSVQTLGTNQLKLERRMDTEYAIRYTSPEAARDFGAVNGQLGEYRYRLNDIEPRVRKLESLRR